MSQPETSRGSQDIHRAPPHSVEAEQGVLGSMLISPKEAITECVARINEEYFYIPAHQTIYSVLIELWRAKTAIDLITFTQILRDRNLLDEVGGASFVTSLSTFVPTAANVGYYLEIVRDKYILRQIIAISTESVRRAFEEQDEVDDLLRQLQSKILTIETRKGHSSISVETVQEVREMAYEREVGSDIALLTGVGAWDNFIKGIFKKRFYVLGARPKVGKTAMIEQMAQHQIENGHHVLIFERDMSPTDLIGRMACRSADVVFDDFMTGHCDAIALRKVHAALDRMPTDKLHLYSPASLSAEDVASIVEREIAEHGIRVFYLDLFQRLKTKERDRVEGLVAAANTMREIIQSTGVPGVILAEVLKEADKTGRPNSGQFKYCDGLFSSCDTSILLWSDEDPKKLIEPNGAMRRQCVTFTVDANRAGSVGDSAMYFDRPKMKFYAEPAEDDL
jgi:replicative DNA helicase